EIVTKAITAERWGAQFAEELNKAMSLSLYSMSDQEKLTRSSLIQQFAKASVNGKRFFFLDYDGTLTPIVAQPEMAKPSEEVKHLLRKLSKLPNTYVYICSGRDRNNLQEWLGDLPVGLVAEHGMVYRDPISLNEEDGKISDDKQDIPQWTQLIEQPDLSWIDTILPIMQAAADHTPNSRIEVKTSSLCFHYRQSPIDFGERQAAELRFNLTAKAATLPIEVISGRCIIEVRSKGVNKGAVLKKILYSQHGIPVSPSPHSLSRSVSADGKSFSQTRGVSPSIQGIALPYASAAAQISLPSTSSIPQAFDNSGFNSMAQPSEVPPTQFGSNITGQQLQSSSENPRASSPTFNRNQQSNVQACHRSTTLTADQCFIMCCGDDRTDEDLFEAANTMPNSITVIVGSNPSQARSRVKTVFVLLRMLNGLTEHVNGVSPQSSPLSPIISSPQTSASEQFAPPSSTLQGILPTKGDPFVAPSSGRRAVNQ
ncbi:MAG: Trehalose 6-phosphate synthase/phosphatase, partial [Streblomastix strix]